MSTRRLRVVLDLLIFSAARRDAATLKPMLAEGGARVATIDSVHPSPLSAQRGFFGSRPFSRANALLSDLGAEPVDWQLP